MPGVGTDPSETRTISGDRKVLGCGILFVPQTDFLHTRQFIGLTTNLMENLIESFLRPASLIVWYVVSYMDTIMNCRFRGVFSLYLIRDPFRSLVPYAAEV